MGVVRGLVDEERSPPVWKVECGPFHANDISQGIVDLRVEPEEGLEVGVSGDGEGVTASDLEVVAVHRDEDRVQDVAPVATKP